MTTTDTLKEQIRSAFTAVKYPGDKNLRGSDQGDEPFMVEHDFYGKSDWRVLSPEFIDSAPSGLGSALSFFSDSAFRFYLPAYLLADIDGKLERSDPVFHLTHGFDRRSRQERINPKAANERTGRDYARERFSSFTRDEAAAIVGYLEFKSATDDLARDTIDEALLDYWYERAA